MIDEPILHLNRIIWLSEKHCIFNSIGLQIDAASIKIIFKKAN